MYELRKWISKPLLKETIYSPMSFEKLSEVIVEVCEQDNISNEKDFFEMYEIEELETGLKNKEVNIIFNSLDCRISNNNTKRVDQNMIEKEINGKPHVIIPREDWEMMWRLLRRIDVLGEKYGNL
ncbi:hypothetical protein TL18_08160 [Methanobrevibacter sp. YE315]|uniref:hypothetical protein n=1 Tax=Methanobrevibacter sp. YE315 TaxID=1609968 RepID=UPI000764E045|nr:hypothetical protein [Methanobrevibacter sp. YE315]AMD18003.1 hypothetical protein TL18_08160 [Methanobrevibacter sp. YE315]